MINVLHVETGRRLYGGALQVQYIVRGLAELGIQNILATVPENPLVENLSGAKNVDVVSLKCAGDLDVRLYFSLLDVIRTHGPDIVHLHSRRGADVLGGLAALRAAVPCVLSRRVDNPEHPLAAGIKYRLYDRVIAISDGIRNVLIKEGLPPEKVVLVRSAIDSTRYSSVCDRKWFESELGLPRNSRVIGTVAQLIKRKGHKYILQLASDVVKKHPDVRFVIFGRGKLEKTLRREIHLRGLDNIVILAGFRPEIKKYLSCFYALLHPALMEGLGIALLEASASMVPVIATRTGGSPEAVLDKVTGFIVPPGQSSPLKEALLTLLDSPALRDEMGRAARGFVETEFSIDEMVRGNLSLYREILKGRKLKP